MRCALSLLVCLAVLSTANLIGLGQTPQTPPPTPAPAKPAAPAPAKPAPSGGGRQASAAARSSISVQVTNMEGKALPEVWAKASGPVDREGPTDSSGMVTFNNVTAGSYRLRFENDKFVTLERDVTVLTGKPLRLSVGLTAAPPPPPPPKAEPAPAPAAALPPTEGYAPSVVSVQAWIESNFVGRAPSKNRSAGCTGATASTMVQTNESIAEHSHADADETIYIVAGEGTFKVAGRESPLAASSFISVPRGMAHSIARKGSRPLMFVSTLSGTPCTVGK